MRDNDASWNEIRAELKVRTASGTFQKLWKLEGIPHKPSSKAETDRRLATLKATRDAPGTTKRGRGFSGYVTALPAGARECMACGSRGYGLQRHHVVYCMDIEARGIEAAVTHDTRNLVWLCPPCHQRQTNGARPISVGALPDTALQFASEVLGNDAAREYLATRYADAPEPR